MPCAVGLGFLDAQKDFRTDPWPNSLVRMAHDREPGSHDLAETIPQDHQAAPSSKPVRGSNGCSGPAMAAVLATGSGAPRSNCCPAVGAPNASTTANASCSSPSSSGPWERWPGGGNHSETDQEGLEVPERSRIDCCACRETPGPALQHGYSVRLGNVMGRDPQLPGAGTGAATALAGSDPPDDPSARGVDRGDQASVPRNQPTPFPTVRSPPSTPAGSITVQPTRRLSAGSMRHKGPGALRHHPPVPWPPEHGRRVTSLGDLAVVGGH